MFFVYLKDGRRIDIPEAAAVVHRTMVLFLDDEDNIVEQFATNDIVAYSRTPYVEDAQGHQCLRARCRDVEGDLIMLRRHRRRRNGSARRDPAYDDRLACCSARRRAARAKPRIAEGRPHSRPAFAIATWRLLELRQHLARRDDVAVDAQLLRVDAQRQADELRQVQDRHLEPVDLGVLGRVRLLRVEVEVAERAGRDQAVGAFLLRLAEVVARPSSASSSC